jgi:hypothetical protein
MENHLQNVQIDGEHEFQNGPIGFQNFISTQLTSFSDADSSGRRPVLPIRAFDGCPIMDPIS